MKEKNKNIGTILGIIMLLIMIIGVTYAAFQYTKTGTKENEITTGTVSFVYNETSNGVSITNAFPMDDEEGKKLQDTGEDITKGYFDFDVTSTMGDNMEIQYYVYAVDVTGEEENKLDTKYVKVYLTDQNTIENPYPGYDENVPVYSDLDDISATDDKGSPVEGKLLYQNKFTSSGEHLYRLRLWVSDEYETTEVSKIFKMRVDVNTEAKIIPKDQNKPTCEVLNAKPEKANGTQDITMQIKCTDDNGTVTSNMKSDNIHVKVNNEDVTPTKKELTEGIAATEVTGENGVEHTLTLSGFEKDGPLSLTIDSGVVKDQYDNTNDEQTLTPNVTIDTTGPVCKLLNTDPVTGEVEQNGTVPMVIDCTDASGTINKDLTKENITVTLGEEEGASDVTIDSGSPIENGKEYKLSLTNFNKTGKLGLTITEGAIEDIYENQNKTTPITTSITIIEGTQKGLESNPSDEEYNEETKHDMFEFEQPDGSTGYRYIGDDPYNYVNLLGTDEGKTDANLWRIIGVFEDENANGVKEKRIKLILNDRINDKAYSWDQTNSNNWSRPAGLNTALNDLFWDSKSGNCPTSSSTTSCDFSNYNIKNVQNKIENMKWYLGSGPWQEGQSTESFYTMERGNTVPAGSSSTWNGYVGLPYPSDWGYTYANGVSTICYEKTAYISGGCTKAEAQKAWMYNSLYHIWTLTPQSHSTNSALIVNSGGYLAGSYVNDGYPGVRPAIYLKSSVGITGGNGTKDEPYTVGEIVPICKIKNVTPESPTYEDEVQVKIECTDIKGKVKSNLTSEDIEVQLNGEKVNLTKELSEANDIENGIEHTLTLNGFEKGGTLSLTIPANKVTNKSGNSNIETSLTVTKIKGKIIEVNGVPSNLADSEYNEDTKHEMFEFKQESTDQKDATTDYRYIGDDPYNYVNLLGTDEGKTDSNLWRIIGVFDDPSSLEDDKIGSKKIKLILNNTLNNTIYSWDNNGQYGSNNWNRPSALNSALNNLFWNSTSGSCPYCSGSYPNYCSPGTISCNFESYNLKSVQNKIEKMKWYLGGAPFGTSSNLSTIRFYQLERGNTAAGGGGGITATGYVGLAYPSDFGYTYANGVDDTCYKLPAACSTGNLSEGWMLKSRHPWWLITSASGADADVFYVNDGSSMSTMASTPAKNTFSYVRPVVYLKSNIGITGGQGTKDEPYTVGEIQ